MPSCAKNSVSVTVADGGDCDGDHSLDDDNDCDNDNDAAGEPECANDDDDDDNDDDSGVGVVVRSDCGTIEDTAAHDDTGPLSDCDAVRCSDDATGDGDGGPGGSRRCTRGGGLTRCLVGDDDDDDDDAGVEAGDDVGDVLRLPPLP